MKLKCKLKEKQDVTVALDSNPHVFTMRLHVPRNATHGIATAFLSVCSSIKKS